MALSDTGYSRLVTGLKIGLPLIALAILSTLFLLARTPTIERAIPYADVDVEGLAREPRITAPDFSGVTPDGVAVSMTARSAQPDPQDPARFLAEGMVGEIRSAEGTRLRLTAIKGVVDTGTGLATLAGDVLIETSTGYAMRAEALQARLDSAYTESDGPVDVTAPFGHLTAGGVRFEPGAEGAPEQLVFTGGVNLIYEPLN